MSGMLLLAQVPLKVGPRHAVHAHLFLTVSTGTPGVAFPSRHLHSVGQPGRRDRLCGLQAALNLQTKPTMSHRAHSDGHRHAFIHCFCFLVICKGLTSRLLIRWYKMINKITTDRKTHSVTAADHKPAQSGQLLTDLSCELADHWWP